MPATVSGASRFYLKHPTLHHRSRSKAVGIVAAAMARIEAGPRALGIANRIGAAIAKHDPLHPLKSHQQALYPVGHGSALTLLEGWNIFPQSGLARPRFLVPSILDRGPIFHDTLAPMISMRCF